MSEPNKTSSKLNRLLDKLVFYFILGYGLFTTFAGLPGFIGYLSDQSPTKWNALFVGGFSGAMTFVIGNWEKSNHFDCYHNSIKSTVSTPYEGG
jgi:hypothetical protein